MDIDDCSWIFQGCVQIVRPDSGSRAVTASGDQIINSRLPPIS